MNKYLSLILLCGGSGLRMRSSLPKQFLFLKDKVLALHSFDFFCQLNDVKEIVVVCDPKYNFYFKSKKVSAFATPGKRRQDSVFNGFNLINKKSELICIHDGVRPFLKKDEVEKAIDAAAKYGAAALGAKIKNTIKQCTDEFAENTLDRDPLYEVYTPQIIKKELLEQGLIYAKKNSIEVTDDLSLIELIGHRSKIIDSSNINIKITTPSDLRVAEAISTL